MAHLSKDEQLIRCLCNDGDVFRQIAAKMFKISNDEVSDAKRQQAKRVCYGMIYGIGNAALAEQLGVSAAEANRFRKQFLSTYPNVTNFMISTIRFAQKNKYVKTMEGKMRILNAIQCQVQAAKSHAERQAVNTTIQGSAADLAKIAMINIDTKLKQTFPNSTNLSAKSLSKSNTPVPEGAFLIIQLHDELIYEVNSNNIQQVAKIVKEGMENAMKLVVPLPVRIKVGPSWGDMALYESF